MFLLPSLVQFAQQSLVIPAFKLFIGKRANDAYVGEHFGGEGGSEGHLVGVLFLQFFHLLDDQQHHAGDDGSEDQDEESQFPTNEPQQQQTAHELQQVTNQDRHIVRTHRVHRCDVVPQTRQQFSRLVLVVKRNILKQ